MMKTCHSLRTNLATVVMRLGSVVLLLMTGLSGSVAAQESSEGTVEVSVTILPSSEELTIDGREVRISGAVWASLAIVHDLHSEPGSGDEPSNTILLVGDNRGTAAGWTVAISVGSTGSDDAAPSIVRNDTMTIQRLLPVTEESPDRVAGVLTGGTLGRLTHPIRVLLAIPTTGSGVFRQNLLVDYTGFGEGAVRTIFVEIAYAP